MLNDLVFNVLIIVVIELLILISHKFSENTKNHTKPVNQSINPYLRISICDTKKRTIKSTMQTEVIIIDRNAYVLYM
jgi:hypothetical protein